MEIEDTYCYNITTKKWISVIDNIATCSVCKKTRTIEHFRQVDVTTFLCNDNPTCIIINNYKIDEAGAIRRPPYNKRLELWYLGPNWSGKIQTQGKLKMDAELEAHTKNLALGVHLHYVTQDPRPVTHNGYVYEDRHRWYPPYPMDTPFIPSE
jgi:hypothetical protein